MSDGGINSAVDSTANSNVAQKLQPGFDTLKNGQLGWRHRRANSRW
jgi:hypothetical protein